MYIYQFSQPVTLKEGGGRQKTQLLILAQSGNPNSKPTHHTCHEFMNASTCKSLHPLVEWTSHSCTSNRSVSVVVELFKSLPKAVMERAFKGVDSLNK